MRLKHSSEAHSEQMELACETLAILGYVDPPRGRGVRILSLDGGGTRFVFDHIRSSVCVCYQTYLQEVGY